MCWVTHQRICCTLYVVMWNETLHLLQMVKPLLLCRQQGEELHEKTCGMRNCRRNFYASLEVGMPLARLPKYNNRPRCLRVVNSGIHAPHLRDLVVLIVILKPLKPSILLIFEHLGPYSQLLPPYLKQTIDLNSTIPLALAAAFLAEAIIYLSSSSVIG